MLSAGSAGNDAGATADSVTKTPVEGQGEGFGWVRCSIPCFCFKRKTRSAQFLDNQLAQWFARWLVIEGLKWLVQSVFQVMESDGDDTQLDDTELASMYIISYKKV